MSKSCQSKYRYYPFDLMWRGGRTNWKASPKTRIMIMYIIIEEYLTMISISLGNLDYYQNIIRPTRLKAGLVISEQI